MLLGEFQQFGKKRHKISKIQQFFEILPNLEYVLSFLKLRQITTSNSMNKNTGSVHMFESLRLEKRAKANYGLSNFRGNI